MNLIESLARTVLHHTRRALKLDGADRPDLRHRNVRAKRSDLTSEQVKHWNKNGFLVLPGFVDAARIDRINAEVEGHWQESRSAASVLTVDIFLGEGEQRVKLHDAPLTAKDRPYKLNDLYLTSPAVRETILDPRLARILGDLLDGEPLACNTLNFEFGSEQDFHTDSLYMTPPKDLNLIATWIALEDCTPDAGPLRYYPGSHRIKPYLFSHGSMNAIGAEMPGYQAYMKGQLARHGLREETFCAKKGDVFIWHSQLFHGGSPIKNKAKTRKSLVTHYFRSADIGGTQVKQGAFGSYMERPHQPVPAAKG